MTWTLVNIHQDKVEVMDSIFNRLLDLTDHYSQSLFSTIAIDIFKHHEIISITAINIFEQQSINSTMANDFLITSRKIGDQVPYPYVSTWNISCLVATNYSVVDFYNYIMAKLKHIVEFNKQVIIFGSLS